MTLRPLLPLNSPSGVAVTSAGWPAPSPLEDLTRDGWRRVRWAQHPYTVRSPGESVVLVAEPYELSADDFAQLHALTDAGWTVVVDAASARHLPGQSIAVMLSPLDGPLGDEPGWWPDRCGCAGCDQERA
jgi:hypothetical protein